jgi:hypothetical protein
MVSEKTAKLKSFGLKISATKQAHACKRMKNELADKKEGPPETLRTSW